MNDLFQKAAEIWTSGGWAMIALAINALILFTIGLATKIKLSEKKYGKLKDKTLMDWIENPSKRKGELGRFLDAATNVASFRQLDRLFTEFRQTEIAPFARDLRIMSVAVSASPLLGLLGTVNGMLTTFSALSTGTGGEKTVDMVAAGISEALVTTETGLIIALPGLLFMHNLRQQHEGYKASLAHIETLCTQVLHRKSSKTDTQSQSHQSSPASADNSASVAEVPAALPNRSEPEPVPAR